MPPNRAIWYNLDVWMSLLMKSLFSFFVFLSACSSGLAAAVTTASGRFSDVSFDLRVEGGKAVFDFVVDDGNPEEAIAAAQKLADAGKEVWRADGIEMLIGNPDARVQFACDFLGRTYTDTAGSDPECEVKVEGTKFLVRYAVPLAVLPRCADCDLESRANFLRKKRKHIQAWKTGYGPMEKAGVIAYAPADEVKAFKENRAQAAAEHAARIEALRRGGAAECRALPRLAEEERMERIPDAWRPAKTFGKDYRFLIPSELVDRFESFGLTNSALFADSMFWTQWNHCVPKAYQPGGYVAKLLDRYPDKPFAIKGGDVGPFKLTSERKASPEVRLFFDKAFMDSLFDRWDERFVGFTDSEAFVSGPGKFRMRLDILGLPAPQTREEAYRHFRFCYHYQTNDVPDLAPFRHMANVSPYVRGRYSNAAAATFNSFIAAQGDRMTGNETGDCMGPQAEKFAFARGSARQFGIPWRNYQTYYSWSKVVTPEGLSGGVRTVYAYYDLVSPKCRLQKYGHLNSPTWGTDRPRRKNFMFHPYFSGASVWSSEAIVVELFGHFDEDEIKTADPAVVALRDVKTYPSPLLREHLRFWDEVVRKRDRGVQVTPIAFVWDRAHGYAPLYFYNRVWDFLAPSELEKGMWATCRHVFRCNADNSACDTSPWGDVFDMVTNDADADFLANYRVLWPVGDVTLDDAFAAKVREAVRRGATFVVNAELLARYPKAFGEDFLGCRLTGRTGRSPSTWLVGESREVAETYVYNYREVEPAGAETLAVTTDGRASPAVTLNRYGRGRVLVTTPANLKVPGSFTTMLNLFDELMAKVRADVLPIRVETTAEYGVAFNGRSWVFHLNNNAGATPREGRSPEPLETDVTKTADVRILVPESLGDFSEALDWWTGERKTLVREQVDGVWYRVFRTVLAGGDSTIVEVMK